MPRPPQVNPAAPEIDPVINPPADPPSEDKGPPDHAGPPVAYMGMDPDTRRVFIQTTDFDDHTFPRGPAGAGWPMRVIQMPPGHLKRWQRCLRGNLADDGLPNDQQDQLHRELWNEADPTGPRWPYLTHEEEAEATGALPLAEPPPPKKR